MAGCLLVYSKDEISVVSAEEEENVLSFIFFVLFSFLFRFSSSFTLDYSHRRCTWKNQQNEIFNKIIPNRKDHRSASIHGNWRSTALTCSSTCFFFFLLSLYMTKTGGCTVIYRCSVFGIWVKGQHAGSRYERPFWEIE